MMRRKIRKLKRAVRRGISPKQVTMLRRQLVKASKQKAKLRSQLAGQLKNRVKEAKKIAFAKALLVVSRLNAKKNQARRRAIILADAKFEKQFRKKLAHALVH